MRVIVTVSESLLYLHSMPEEKEHLNMSKKTPRDSNDAVSDTTAAQVSEKRKAKAKGRSQDHEAAPPATGSRLDCLFAFQTEGKQKLSVELWNEAKPGVRQDILNDKSTLLISSALGVFCDSCDVQCNDEEFSKLVGTLAAMDACEDTKIALCFNDLPGLQDVELGGSVNVRMLLPDFGRHVKVDAVERDFAQQISALLWQDDSFNVVLPILAGTSGSGKTYTMLRH